MNSKIGRFALRIGVVAAITTSSLIGVVSGANADNGGAVPFSCPPDIYYVINSNAERFLGLGLTYKDGPGGNISVSNSVAGTISATMTVGAEAEIGAVLAKAKASISASLTASVQITTGHTFSHNITSNKYGNAQYGSWGKTIKWTKEQDTPQCGVRVLSSGTMIAPTIKVGYKYWETSS